ncbi:Na/Pi cotransporter family protein [Wenzhouxiangella limi]|uniref:Na/Pi cotransporter family protein n=1 Tax=Wenzhouxiangella limi TaxID=2707351 RepID=A0A845UZ16_9GAMM|nr:Na/Pi symporter [Wenzhouxiangella limi]NDY95140.1 Na/Pi cotransporter family protein [Wenzhouxiangella limi]
MRFRQLPLIFAMALLGWALLASPTLTEIAAGIAIFLFGMLILEQGFRTFTGGVLENLLKRSTDRLWKGLAFGALATTATQSSSLVSVITISFLSAGLLGLGQGIGVIFGANLGTTSGAWLMAGFGIRVNISAYAMPLLIFGVLLIFNRSRSLKGAGYVLAGIGFLFLGIHYMKEGFEAYQQGIDLARYAVGGVPGLFLYILIGMVATVVMQSSHATLILTITALSAGQIGYENALALSIGANVGTTITALIGAGGANIAGRRLAAAHVIFNVTTGLIALVFIQAFLGAVDTVSSWLGIASDNHTLKLALFHSLFNLTGIVIMVPFVNRLVELLETKMQPRPTTLDEPKFISETMLETPAAALEATRRELLRLFRRAFSLIAKVLNYETGQLRQPTSNAELAIEPRRIRVVDVDDRYRQQIKPLHGLILDYLARLPVQGHRARQLVMLRVAAQDLIEAVKDAKHLQKNMIPSLTANNRDLKAEYLAIRCNLGYLLHQLDRMAARAEAGDEDLDLELELADLDSEIEAGDIVHNGRLDDLIRQGRISAEQATSLMNDTAYGYRIAKNLLAMARATFLPFEQIDAELRQALELRPDEVRDILNEINGASGRQTGDSP